MDLKETYNRIAEDWFEDHHGDSWWVEGTDTFVSLLSRNALVLDIGCGAGVKSKYLSDKGLKVVGADFSEKMIEIAKREVPAADFRVADIKDLGTIPETLDGVFAQAVLLHIPKNEAGKVVAGLAHKLREGGYLYIAVKEKWPDGKEEEVLKENDYGYEYERFFSYFTLPEIKKHLIEAGLQVRYENVSRAGRTNWIQVIAQK
ncbi:MAG: class I SAM-dependent methyltransferase [Patescibacteria group bacterium]|nr:class I SAM-dependent methyltransferase [Patescibacteria group bacterium]